jgi:hypothetical protein
VRKRFARCFLSRPLWQFALFVAVFDFVFMFIIWSVFWDVNGRTGMHPLDAAVVFAIPQAGLQTWVRWNRQEIGQKTESADDHHA